MTIEVRTGRIARINDQPGHLSLSIRDALTGKLCSAFGSDGRVPVLRAGIVDFGGKPSIRFAVDQDVVFTEREDLAPGFSPRAYRFADLATWQIRCAELEKSQTCVVCGAPPTVFCNSCSKPHCHDCVVSAALHEDQFFMKEEVLKRLKLVQAGGFVCLMCISGGLKTPYALALIKVWWESNGKNKPSQVLYTTN